ncbi:MAG: hypothetical protein Q7S05_01745, partial [bacterium]|nr:hypothetical protein [bacterium]
MSDEIFFDGVKYVSASDASREGGITRDHVGRLCRDGKMAGKFIGKKWYVSYPSLRSFLLTQAHTQFSHCEEMVSEGIRYISVSDAARASNLTRDHIARLCREDKVIGKQVGKNWFVSQISFQSFLLTQTHEHFSRSEELSRQRTREYRTVQGQRNISVEPPALLPKNIISIGGLRPAESRQYNSDRFPSDFTKSLSITPNLCQKSSRLNQTEESINPTLELAHKLTALFVAAMLTFGTYSVVDPAPARTAYESMKSAGRGIAQLPA